MKWVLGFLLCLADSYSADSVYEFFPNTRHDTLEYQRTWHRSTDTLDNETFRFITSYDTNQAILGLSVHEKGFRRLSDGTTQNVDASYSDTCLISASGDNLTCKGDARNYSASTKFFSVNSKYVYIDSVWTYPYGTYLKWWYYHLNDSLYLYSEYNSPWYHSTAPGSLETKFWLKDLGLVLSRDSSHLGDDVTEYSLLKVNSLPFAFDGDKIKSSGRIDALISNPRRGVLRKPHDFYDTFILGQSILGRNIRLK